jgi:hypothetical protein
VDVLEDGMSEYAFDVTLIGAIRVEAGSRKEAEAMVRDSLDCASVNAGAWPNGDPILFEASVD